MREYSALQGALTYLLDIHDLATMREMKKSSLTAGIINSSFHFWILNPVETIESKFQATVLVMATNKRTTL